MNLINVDKLLKQMNAQYIKDREYIDDEYSFAEGFVSMETLIKNQPTVDAVPVVRCKNCIFYKKPHVRCEDGTEKDFSEFPDDAYKLGRGAGVGVSGEYGINVGGQCTWPSEMREYSLNKDIFVEPDGYCSRGSKMDG